MLAVNAFINQDSPRKSFSIAISPSSTKWSQLKQTIKALLPTVVAAVLLLAHSSLGALIFWKVENSLAIIPREMRTVRSCFVNQTYYTTLYQSNIVTVALGYNRIRPCTIAGRGYSVLHCWIGIPIVVEVLSGFGDIMEFLLQSIWVGYLKLKFAFSNRPRIKKLITDQPEPHRPIPVLFGLLISIAWILAATGYVAYAEGHSYFQALMFTARSMTRIAPTFGKLNPTKDLFAQLFIFWIGLTLFSAAIKILQSNLAAMVDKLLVDINNGYKEAQLAGETGNDPDSEAKVEGKMEKMLKSSGAILSKLMSTHDQKKLKEKMEKFSRLKIVSVQAVPVMVDQMVDAVPVQKDQANAIRNGFRILIDTFDLLPNKLTGGLRLPVNKQNSK